MRDFQALIVFFVAGFALLTLLINGVTTRYVVSALKLTRKQFASKYVVSLGAAGFECIESCSTTRLIIFVPLSNDRYAYDAAARHLEEKTMAEIEERLKHDDLYRCEAVQ